MSDNAVRPAVACVAWRWVSNGHLAISDGQPNSDEEYPVTAIDGAADQIAERVRSAVEAGCQCFQMPDPCFACRTTTARVLATLGIPNV
jgi:hypothetical protein